MANESGGLFQTLVAAASQAAQELRYKNAFVDAIYWDYKPDPVQPYTGLNVIIPNVNEGDVTDIGSGPLNPSDTQHTNVQIPFNRHFSSSFVIRAYDQVRTPVNLKDKYVKPKLEALMRKVNRTIVGLVNSTNFNSYSIISGSGADLFNRSDISQAWTNLANAGAPVEDDGNMFLLMNTTAFGNMLSDTNFLTQYIVGTTAAEDIQQQAKVKSIYGTEVRYDQHMSPWTAGKQPGVLMHRYAIAGVTAPLIATGDPSVKETSFKLKGVLPVQMQMQYSLKDQGWLVNLHCWWGVLVARPELGSVIQTA